MARPFLIDTDTASDDAVAIAMAVRHPGVEVDAITVVAGNVPLDQGVQNALYTLEQCGATVPVHAGADRPLVHPLVTAQDVHGLDGMSDLGLPLRGRSPSSLDGVGALLDAAGRHAGSLTLVTLGPLTNVALAVQREPMLARQVARCVVMGGAPDGVGNQTAVAEYNVWADPEALAVVLASGMRVTLVGWDVSRTRAVVTPDQAAELRAIGTPLARFAVDIQRCVADFCAAVTHLPGFDLPDPVAMAVALDPEVATTTFRGPVTVVTGDGPERGRIVLGEPDPAHPVEVVLDADRDRFWALLVAALGPTDDRGATGSGATTSGR